MPDYSKYNVPSPDMYHAVFADCAACLKSIIHEEEFTVKELLEEIDKHEKICDPKVWLYRHGYVREIEHHDGVVNRYERWFDDEQNGLCSICFVHEDTLFVDHCHTTNIVRGLICHRCNVGLGYFRDSIEFLSSAIKYLENGKNFKTK